MKTVTSAVIAATAIALAVPAIATAAPSAATSTAQAPAAAPDAAPPKVGDAVYDTAGVAVGTIESIAGDIFILATDTGKATLALQALGHGAQGHKLGVTKAELDEAIRKAASAPKG